MRVFCPECRTTAELTPEQYACNCGGAWEFEEINDFNPSLLDPTETSVWRYRKLFQLDFDEPTVRLGAGWTPLLPAFLENRQVLLKPEYFAPTSSFKDRGTTVMINILVHQGAGRIAEDSSGNAGASVAAYAARAGMQADIYVPAHASAAKQAQISVYGAQVHPIPGPRQNAKLAVIEAVEKGEVVLASHAYHPGFLLGQETLAWELWEQLGGKAPDWYIVPVGQGVHLLGVWLGFKRLESAGLVERTPRMVGVQPALLSPICQALEEGLDHVPGVAPGQPSIAEGLAIATPLRGSRILQAIRESGGSCITVGEDEIAEGRSTLAKKGFYIEPTSATIVAALKQVLPMTSPNDTIVMPLTGSGLKGSPSISKPV